MPTQNALTMSVGFDTDIETVELFNQARERDLNALQWVLSMQSVPIAPDRVWMTLVIYHDHYASVLAGMDGVFEYVPLAIEQELLFYALEVIEALDPAAEQEGEGPPYGRSTANYDDDWEIPF